MERQRPTEAELVKQILILRQKYKQQKKEERKYIKKNKRLVNEAQSNKEMLKSLNDERLVLKKDIYDKKYAKSVSEGTNDVLKNNLSSFLNDLHALQSKVINSWRENQSESLVGNRHSSKRSAESSRQEIVEEQTVSEEPDRVSVASSPLQDVSNTQDRISVGKVEALNNNEVKPILTSPCNLSESKQELSVFLNSFCRRDTVALDKNSGPVCQDTETAPLDKTCKLDNRDSELVSLEITCEPDNRESETVPLEKICEPKESEIMSLKRTCKRDCQESANSSLESTCKSDFQRSEIVPLEKNCEPAFHESENLSLERSCELDCQLSGNEDGRTSPQEPFDGFEDDPKENARVTGLGSLRNFEIGQSLTVMESNPEITTKETAAVSTLEVDLTKQYKILQLEVSIPKLNLSAHPSLDSTIEVPKKRVSTRRSTKIAKAEERNQRDTTPDSASETSSSGNCEEVKHSHQLIR
nr:uncharacterized protein LOC106684224 [Halyomorpha halys]